MKSNEVIIIMGSHRKQGNTAYWVQNIKQALDQTAIAYKVFDINDLNINHCIDCTVCRQRWRECIHDDDMNAVYDALQMAKIIVWATPVYYNGLTSKLKTLVDRCQMIFMCDFAHQKPFTTQESPQSKNGFIVSIGGAKAYENQFVGNELSLKLVFDNIHMRLVQHLKYNNTDRIHLSDQPNVLEDVTRIVKFIENEVKVIER